MPLFNTLFLGLMALAVLAAIYAFAIEPNWLRVRHRIVTVPGLPRSAHGLKILHISDFHIGFHNRRLIGLLDRVASIPADVVLITGDFIDTPSAAPEISQVLGPFVERQQRPVIGVLGNHDGFYYLHRIRRSLARYFDNTAVVEALRATGITLLIDSAVEIETSNGELTIVGVDVVSHTPEGVAAALGGRNPRTVVLAAHTPDILGVARRQGIPLVLCGHTHGGQIRLGPWITPTTSTSVRLKPPSGLIDRGTTQMHVSPGLGTTLIPMRFFSRPEATVIEIRVPDPT